MYKTRFEEYFGDPSEHFILRTDLERTSEKYSSESNWHEDIEIEICTDGEGEILINGETLPFFKDEIAVINSNYIHHTGTKSRIVYDCLIIKSSFFKLYSIKTDNINFQNKFTSEYIKNLLIELKQITKCNTRFKIARENIILLKIAIHLCENYSTDINNASSHEASLNRVREVIKIIRRYYSDRITLDYISKIICCDKYALCRDFKKSTGQTIIGYLNKYRCQVATEYLKSGFSVSEAASACGFESTSYFTKTFKELTGTLPSEYKNNA